MTATRELVIPELPRLERLHNLDAEFLYIEDDDSPMHIGCVCVFDGPVPTRAEIKQLFAAKLPYVPRYRRRVRFLPFDLGRPVWADDPHFDLDYHVRRTALPEPHDDSALCALVGRLMSQRLDRDRPLWEVWIVEGLEDGRWAFVSKVHHAMVDGVSGSELMTTIMDREPDAVLPPVRPWKPAPDPTPLELLRHALESAGEDYWGLQRTLWQQYMHPVREGKVALERVAGLARLGRDLLTTSSGPFQGKISGHRFYAHASAKLADAQRVRKTFGGTINDVILTAVSGGYRALIASRGADPDSAVVRSMVPVSVRAPDARGVYDNRVSMVLCDLAVRVADPVQRLASISAEMKRLKGSHVIEAISWLNTLGDVAPPWWVAGSSRAFARISHSLPQRSFATVTTNVPGPRYPLYIVGRRMLSWFPYVPITQGLRVGTAILSYDDHLSFGITGDYDSVPDVQVITRGIESTLAHLVARAEGNPVPAEPALEAPRTDASTSGAPRVRLVAE